MNGYFRIRMISLQWVIHTFDSNQKPTPENDIGPFANITDAQQMGKELEKQGHLDMDKQDHIKRGKDLV